jgi:hypothetical protein
MIIKNRKSSGILKFEIVQSTKSEKISLSRFEKMVLSHPKIGKELAKNVIEHQRIKLKKLGLEKLKKVGFSKEDIKNISQIDLTLPSEDLGFALLPRWILDFLDNYWRPYNPRYVVVFENLSDFSHDFVLAYETESGLIDTKQTTIGAWSTGSITCAPCWDMLRYNWDVWNPEDNLNLGGPQRALTIAEINAMENPVVQCRDTWEVRIEY